jgi:uncharacterized protein (DUF58 family)
MALSIPYRVCRADDHGVARVTPRNIYILPTRYGLLFGMLLLVLLLIAVNYTNNPVFLLAFLLAGVAIVSMLHTWRNLVNLQLSPGREAALFAGQPLRYEIHVRNGAPRQRPNIMLKLRSANGVERDLPAAASASYQLYLDSSRRGRRPLPRVQLSSHYPLGLFRAWSYVELPLYALVYPAPGETPAPGGEAAAHGDSRDAHRDETFSGADDFVGLRQYQRGDGLKQINWKAYAREQGLQTNLFSGASSAEYWLEWDALPNMETEQRLSALCRGVLDASEMQHAFGLRLPGVEIPPARGDDHLRRCLAALALHGEPP